MYDVASMLHKTVAEIEEMSVDEFIGWQAWWRIRHDRQDDKLGL